jgi:hypothetical protein
VPDSYSWNFLGDPSETEASAPLPDVQVERFALSHILVPFVGYPSAAITAVNIHPDTWNSLMFPYGGLRLDDAKAAAGAATFADLAGVLRGLIDTNAGAYLDGARAELREYFTELPELESLAPVYRNFSLKFSKSAEKWTAYVFTYHPCPESLLAVPADSRRRIPLDTAAVAAAVSANQLDGIALEENVAALLQSGIVRFWSQG